MALPAKNIDHYQLIEEVGVGGLGRVFRALDSHTGKYVAIKMLHDRFTQSRKFLGIFHRELLIISRLHHKNIVSYLDSGFQPPDCYIVTEFVEGSSLYALMKKTGRMPPVVALCILIDMLQGIDHLHLHDVIHSDLSAPNVLIQNTGRVLVTDFGLACQQEVEDYKNYMVGTPGYYSPEHVTESAIVPQTDLYCAGLILYEMLTASKAVPASQDRKKVYQGMKKISFSQIQSDDRKLMAMLRKLLKVTLHINPNKRAQTSESMMFAVYSILKQYNIRYARYAIEQYLIDQGIVEGVLKGPKQDIYRGFIG